MTKVSPNSRLLSWPERGVTDRRLDKEAVPKDGIVMRGTGCSCDRPMKVLGIDIGGSAIKGAPVETTSGRLLADRFKIETPLLLSPTEMADAAGLIAAHFRWRGPVGIGFPGDRKSVV